MMFLDIQPTVVMMAQDKEQVGGDRYTSKSKADLRAKEISGTVIKEQGEEIYWVFKDVPNKTVSYITEE